MKKLINIFNSRAWLSYLIIVVLAATDALVSIVLIYPNDFAPVGVQGFVVMIQHLFGISVGYTYILINAPMLIMAFFVLNKGYSLKNLSYIVSFSAMTIIFQQIISNFDLNTVRFQADTTEKIIAAAVGYGIFFGTVYPLTVWLGGSTGGTDILATLINRFKPRFNTVWVLFFINTAVAIASYFVYGRRTLPVILSISCSLVSGLVSDSILKGDASALKFEIITDNPIQLSNEIMNRLDRGCTQVLAKGMYSGNQSSILICVVNKKQRFEMEKIISKYEGSFGFCTPVKSTYGLFR